MRLHAVSRQNRCQGHGSLEIETYEFVLKLLRAKKRTARSARWYGTKSRLRKRAQSVLFDKHTGCREDPPFEKIAFGDLTTVQSFDNFGAIVARILRFTLPGL